MGEIYTPFIRMKKTLFTLFAVLLVLLPVILMATCYLFELPPNNDERQSMVRLTINPGDGGTDRALNRDLAVDNANFYEVVFKSGTTAPFTYYQAEWNSGDGHITIPIGDYTGAERAVLFAGHDASDVKILLGVGEITEIDSTSLDDMPDNIAYIGPGSHTITFTVTALVSGVKADKATSTFKILGPTNPTNYATGNSGTGPTITVSSVNYPVFPVPASSHSNPDTDFENVAGNIIGEYTFTLPHRAAIILGSAGWGATASPYNPAGLSAPDSPISGNVTCAPDGANTLPGSGTNCPFKFMVNVTGAGTSGLCSVLLDAPVHALSPTALKAPSYTTPGGNTVEWHIRGGIDNTIPDGASSGTDDGALIILAVGTHNP